jgi:hypothetical protein
MSTWAKSLGVVFVDADQDGVVRTHAHGRTTAEVKRVVMDSYSRATELLQTNKKALLNIADALLAREVLDAEQVRKLARGEKLEDPSVVEPSRPPDETAHDRARDTKERPPLVPGISKPLTQE